MEIEDNGFELIKSKVVKSLKDFLIKDTVAKTGETPVVCEMHVPYHQVDIDKEEPGVAQAVITYVVSYIKEKKHTVRVKFQYDSKGKVDKNSLVYV
jgi:hypothetical protein